MLCKPASKINIESENYAIEFDSDPNKKKYRGIYIDQNIVHFIPSGLEKIEDLITLTIRKSKLKKVKGENLSTLKNLEYLDLSWNVLQILEENLFQNNTNLVTIWLNNNQIIFIMPSAFKGLNKEKIFLNLEKNICYHEFSFKNSTKLDVIIKKNTCLMGYASTDKVQTEKSIHKKIEELEEKSKSFSDGIEQKIQTFSSRIQKNEDSIQTINDKLGQNEEKIKQVLEKFSEMNKSFNKSDSTLKLNELSKNYESFKNHIITLISVCFTSLLIIIIMILVIILIVINLDRKSKSNQNLHELKANGSNDIDNDLYDATIEPVYESIEE